MMKKVKHKYICHEPNAQLPGSVAFTINTKRGNIGVYESYGPGSMSNWLTKMQALRHLVRRKHECQQGYTRVKLKEIK